MDIKNDNQKGTIDNFLRTNGITLDPFCKLFGVRSNTYNLWKEKKKIPAWFKEIAIDLGFDVSGFDVFNKAKTDASKVHPKILELVVGKMREFKIPGKAQAKQRPRMGRSGIVYTPKETLVYENYVKMCYSDYAQQFGWFAL